jgi:hypothetical protein
MAEHATAPGPEADAAKEDPTDAVSSSEAAPSPATRFHYEVASVEQASAPDGAQGTDWHRYVLSSGNSRIVGLRRGTREEVAAYASTCAEDFNLRGVTGKGRVASGHTKK